MCIWSSSPIRYAYLWPTFPPLVIRGLFSRTMRLFLVHKWVVGIDFLDSPQKWYHRLPSLFSLASFTLCGHHLVNPCCCKRHSFVLSNGQVIVHGVYSVCMCHIFWIRQSVSGCFGCSPVSFIGNPPSWTLWSVCQFICLLSEGWPWSESARSFGSPV